MCTNRMLQTFTATGAVVSLAWETPELNPIIISSISHTSSFQQNIHRGITQSANLNHILTLPGEGQCPVLLFLPSSLLTWNRCRTSLSNVVDRIWFSHVLTSSWHNFDCDRFFSFNTQQSKHITIPNMVYNTSIEMLENKLPLYILYIKNFMTSRKKTSMT